jgi:hypothetical protein
VGRDDGIKGNTPRALSSPVKTRTRQDEKKQVATLKAIFGSMTEEELDNPNSVNNGRSRTKIAKKAQVVRLMMPMCTVCFTCWLQTEEDVLKVMTMAKSFKVLHAYVHVRKAAGDPLVQSEDELKLLQHSDMRFKQIYMKECAEKLLVACAYRYVRAQDDAPYQTTLVTNVLLARVPRAPLWISLQSARGILGIC